MAERPEKPPPPGEEPAERPELDRAAEVVARMGDGTLLRGVAAVLVGLAVVTIGSVAAGRAVIALTGMGPEASPTAGFLAASLATRLLVAGLAGYLTAKAAPRAPLAHAGALAGVLVLLSVAAIAGLSAAGGLEDPTWYPTAMLFVGPAGVLAGAALLATRSGS